MQAMIFAAGMGTRLKPFTDKHPKALAMVNGKTLLQRNIEQLKLMGCTFMVINVHYLAQQIIEYFKEHNGFGIKYIVSYEKDEILETGGGLQKAFSLFNYLLPIITLNADILTDYDIAEMYQQHINQKNFITLAVSDRFSSRALLFNRDNVLCGWRNIITNEEIIIKDGEHVVPKSFSGISIFDASIKEYFLDKKKYSLIDLFLSAGCKKDIIMKDFSDNKFIDVGTTEKLDYAQSIFL